MIETNSQKSRIFQSLGPEKDKVYKPGDVIGGKFEVRDVLGHGGLGIIYLVYAKEIQEVCALKMLRNEYTRDSVRREAFRNEALLWVNLEEHPFILSARWVGTSYGRLFVLMDYVAPDDRGCASLLDHLVSSRAPLQTNQATQWAIQFCYGMEHAHVHGIKVHQDIKPANILITQDGTLKITDFGLVVETQVTCSGGGRRLVDPWGEQGVGLLRAEGPNVCGTPGYIPPEVYGGEGANVRSDIYSFGLVLWQMAAGCPQPPFGEPPSGDVEGYLEAVYRQQMTGRIPRVEGPLQSVIERCLAPDPSIRFESFRNLRRELESIFHRRTGRSTHNPRVDRRTAAFWNNKGTSLDTLGQYGEAIRCCDRALAIDPRFVAAWNNKGLALRHLGRDGEAIHCFDQCLAIDPRFVAAWNNKGNSLHSLGRYEEAIRCFDQALAIDPRDAPAWNNKGINLRDLSHYGEAIRCFDQCLAIDPRFVAAWNNKGNSLHSLGRYEEAIRCFDQALAIDPRGAPAWYNKSLSKEAMGERDLAATTWRKYLEVARTIPSERQWIRKAEARLRELSGG